MIKGDILQNKLLPIEDIDLFISAMDKKHTYLGIISAETNGVGVEELSNTMKYLNEYFKANNFNVALVATIPGISFTLHELKEEKNDTN